MISMLFTVIMFILYPYTILKLSFMELTYVIIETCTEILQKINEYS